MRHPFRQGLLLLAFVLATAFRVNAQSAILVVTMNDGSEQTFPMYEGDRLYFEDNVKLVIEDNPTKSVTKIPLADIRKMTCTESEGVAEASESAVSMFPNPVHDMLTLRNITGKQTISIYAIDGRLMKTFEASGDQTIDVGDLPMGLYLVKAQTCTLKMIKL